jgi:hypothetical protein
VSEDGIERRIDRLIAIMELAYADQIAAARSAILADPVNSTILEVAAEGWVAAGTLKSRVADRTRQSERTITRRISQLLVRGALEQSGSGPRVTYRATGLI